MNAWYLLCQHMLTRCLYACTHTHTRTHAHTHTHTHTHPVSHKSPTAQAGQGYHLQLTREETRPRTQDSQARSQSLFPQGLYPKCTWSFSALCCAGTYSPPPPAANTTKVRGRQKGKQGFLTGVEQGSELRQPCTPQFSISAESPARRGLLSSGLRTGQRERPLQIQRPFSIPTLPPTIVVPRIQVWARAQGSG